MDDERKIVLQNGKPPELHGNWTIGELTGVVEAMRQWIGSMAIAGIPIEEPDPPVEVEDDTPQ